GEVARVASTRLLPREICTGEQRMGQPWRRSVDQPNSRLISPRLDRLVDVEHACHITARQAIVPRAHSDRGCAEEGQEVGFPVATVWDVQLDVDRSEPNFDVQGLGRPQLQPDACAPAVEAGGRQHAIVPGATEPAMDAEPVGRADAARVDGGGGTAIQDPIASEWPAR